MKKLILFTIFFLSLSGVWFWHALTPTGISTKAEAVRIEPGTSLMQIATLLDSRHLIRSPLAFKIYVRFAGKAARLQAGTFALSPSLSAKEIADVLVGGKSEEFNVTIPEGLTVSDIDALMASKGLGKPGDIIDCAFQCDFSTFDFLPAKASGGREQGIGSRIEGYLFPETYAVSPSGYVPKFFLERMLGTFRKRIVSGHVTEIEKSGRSLHELVTMASLVEEESRHDEERAIISGILWKRLENKVVLGVDATTRYEVKKITEPLTKTELETQSPYNTRRRQGLPPSPIANPGLSSFEAALQPVQSAYWYYLHGKDGLIHYAKTNDEHNLNRAKYIAR